MDAIETLTKYFQKFPGIGPRQARRFVYHLLKEDPQYLDGLSDAVRTIRSSVSQCASCFRYFSEAQGTFTECHICRDSERDPHLLMVLESDSDMFSIEKSGVYNGYYFILGGTIPLLDEQSTQKLRGPALKQKVLERVEDGLSEVILAFSINPDGENTARYVQSLLSELKEAHELTISHLGRGLSTGSELEYADPETIKNALSGRKAE